MKGSTAGALLRPGHSHFFLYPSMHGQAETFSRGKVNEQVVVHEQSQVDHRSIVLDHVIKVFVAFSNENSDYFFFALSSHKLHSCNDLQRILVG